MCALKATLECINQVNIKVNDEEDIWVIEKGEKIDCMICDDGIKIVDIPMFYKPSTISMFFKIKG